MFEPTHAALQDVLRVVFAFANALKNHLTLFAGATAFALSLPS
jgi:hypothetical protein